MWGLPEEGTLRGEVPSVDIELGVGNLLGETRCLVGLR